MKKMFSFSDLQFLAFFVPLCRSEFHQHFVLLSEDLHLTFLVKISQVLFLQKSLVCLHFDNFCWVQKCRSTVFLFLYQMLLFYLASSEKLVNFPSFLSVYVTPLVMSPFLLLRLPPHPSLSEACASVSSSACWFFQDFELL